MLLLLKTSLWKKTMQTWNKLAEWQSPLLKWTLIITVEQVHSYPLPGRMKGGIKWSHLLLTTEVKRQFAHGMLCVWHILCSAFSLVSQFPVTRQASFSAGCTHRALHLQQGWFSRFQHNCSASHYVQPWPVTTGNGVLWEILWGRHQIHKGRGWPILQCHFDFKSTINLPPGVLVLLTQSIHTYL